MKPGETKTISYKDLDWVVTTSMVLGAAIAVLFVLGLILITLF